MTADLQPTDPLSQVVFIHNYLQLVFQDCGFTLYNSVSYELGGSAIEQGDPGFADAVVSLIDQTALVSLGVGSMLTIQFDGGARVRVLASGPGIRGPEAWQLNRIGEPGVIAQNV